MTERTATTIANGVLVAAAVGAAYVVWRTPSLRRLALGLTVSALTGALPAWVGREVRDAWAASGQPATGDRRATRLQRPAPRGAGI
jgi:hypothetical protein